MNRRRYRCGRKRPLISKYISVIIFCALSIAVFANLGLYLHHPNQPGNYEDCLFSAHSSAHIKDELSLLFILPFLGVILLISNIIVPSGFILSPFKPPRFHFK